MAGTAPWSCASNGTKVSPIIASRYDILPQVDGQPRLRSGRVAATSIDMVSTARRARWFASVVAAFVGLTTFGATVAAEPAPQGGLPSCVTVKATARYRNYGYDHVVHVLNGCDRSASCEVSTDVNPTPQVVTVSPKEATEVITFVGSPSRVFTPRVTCELR